MLARSERVSSAKAMATQITSARLLVAFLAVASVAESAPLRNVAQVAVSGMRYENPSNLTMFACGRIGGGEYVGTVSCWGWSDYDGALGLGLLHTSSRTAVPIAGLTNVVDLVAGQAHVCALDGDGYIACWGNNDFGQLGNDTTANSSAPIYLWHLEHVVSITTGAFHTCALTNDTKVECWGRNNFGQLGIGTTVVDHVTSPARVQYAGSDLTGVTAISAGNQHTCAIRSDGTVVCWGDDWFGQLGDGAVLTRGDTAQSSAVQALVFGGVESLKATSIAAGGFHTCATTTGNGLLCWGANSAGQLGDNSTNSRSTPNVVFHSTPHDTKLLTAGDASTCITKTDDVAYCWGNNSGGQLGIGSRDGSSVPVALNFTPPLSGLRITSFAISGRADNDINQLSCAAIAGDKVQCWGYNSFGTLGDGTYTWQDAPQTFVQDDVIFRTRFEAVPNVGDL